LFEGAEPVTDVDANTFAGIDFCRGLFAVLVLVGHAWEYDQRYFGAHSQNPLTNFLTCTIGHGYYWVIGFFVISGFCIQLSIQKARARGVYNFGYFSWARVSRIYPTFLLGLSIAALAWMVGPTFSSSDNRPALSFWTIVVSSLLMLQAFIGTFPSFAQSWSISYEMIYYAIWPLILAFARYSSKRAAMLAIWLALACAFASFLAWKIWAHNAGVTWLIYGCLVPLSGLLWLGGAWLAANWREIQNSRLWLSITSKVVLCYFLVSYGLESWLNYVDARMSSHLLSALFAGPMFLCLLVSLRGIPFGREPWRTACCWLGWLSYPLYLLHRPIQEFALKLATALPLHFGLFSGFLYLLVPVLLVSALIGLPFEVTVLRWRKRTLRRFNPVKPVAGET